jgi:hypothetical protein
MTEWCVFSASSGLIRIGPEGMQRPSPTTQERDVVIILYGGETPFLLRRHNVWYELIGKFYVSETMQGEFMDLYKIYRGHGGCPVEQELELR